jgi:hypothetical protein
MDGPAIDAPASYAPASYAPLPLDDQEEGDWAPGGGAWGGQAAALGLVHRRGPWQRVGPRSSGGRVSCSGERRLAQCVGGIQGRRLVFR